jgi:CheY-like chemotaxis protein
MADQSPKILVVDDQPYMHALMRHHLARAGYKMFKAANGREAVEVATTELPALIVMDVMMEEMDGLAALRQLKALAATKHIPVVMITANAHHVTRADAEASGAVLYLTKPFSPTKLMLEIQRLVASSCQN